MWADGTLLLGSERMGPLTTRGIEGQIIVDIHENRISSISPYISIESPIL